VIDFWVHIRTKLEYPRGAAGERRGGAGVADGIDDRGNLVAISSEG